MPKGVWQLWQDIPEPARGELRAIYRDLRAEFPLRRRLAKRWAALVAESWLVTAATSKSAVLVALQHHAGRGRRPNKRQLGQAGKRQFLQIDGLDQRLLRRLGELAGHRSHSNGHGGADDLAARLLSLPTAAEQRSEL